MGKQAVWSDLSKRQLCIVTGLLLGDGYLYTDGRLQVEQSMKNKQYLNWLYSELSNLSGKIRLNVERKHPKTGVSSFSCRFYTQKCFTNLESIFYSKATSFKKRRKIVPNDIENFLNPIVLAVWFMDDGGKAQNTVRAFYINATSFNNSERILLQKALQNVFGLKINIQKAGGNNQYNFYIPAASYEKFYQLVLPTISLIPEMGYKLGLGFCKPIN